MKIRIEFTEVEKQAILNSIDCEVEDKSKKTISKAGVVTYLKNKNLIDIDFKENYMLSVASFTGRIIRMVTDIMKVTESFITEWCSDDVAEEEINEDDLKEESSESE